MNQDTLWWKLFPFSLTARARTWYDRKVGGVGGDWPKLKDEFCVFFYPITKMLDLRVQILTYQQGDESLGAMWEKFMQMVNSRPPHGIPTEMPMQHFVGGLKPKSSFFVNVNSEASVLYKIVAEIQMILHKVHARTQYIGVFDDPPKPTPIEQPTEKHQISTLVVAAYRLHRLSRRLLIQYMPLFVLALFTKEEYIW